MLRCARRVYWTLATILSEASTLGVEENAKRNFNCGFNCAESVLLTVHNSLNEKDGANDQVIPRAATGFGGGIGRNGDICGALMGGVIAISLALGRDKPDQAREPCYPAVDRLYNDFRTKFGSCRCRELTNVNLKTPQGALTYQTEEVSEIVAVRRETHQDAILATWR